MNYLCRGVSYTIDTLCIRQLNYEGVPFIVIFTSSNVVVGLSCTGLLFLPLESEYM